MNLAKIKAYVLGRYNLNEVTPNVVIATPHEGEDYFVGSMEYVLMKTLCWLQRHHISTGQPRELMVIPSAEIDFMVFYRPETMSVYQRWYDLAAEIRATDYGDPWMNLIAKHNSVGIADYILLTHEVERGGKETQDIG